MAAALIDNLLVNPNGANPYLPNPEPYNRYGGAFQSSSAAAAAAAAAAAVSSYFSGGRGDPVGLYNGGGSGRGGNSGKGGASSSSGNSTASSYLVSITFDR